MRYRDHILIGVFITTIYAPLTVHLAGNATSSAHEKRKLATLPSTPRSWSALTEYPAKFAAYYGDRFGLRATLIRWHALALHHVFRMSPTDKVLAGRDGWLFFADDYSLEDYRSSQPFTTAELELWRTVLEEQHDWLAKRGIRLVIVFACDKHVIYPEYLPPGYRRNDQPYRVQALTDYLRTNSRVNVVALREPLLAGKGNGRIYHRTDTHWNDHGAHIGYREILGALGMQPLAYEQENVTTPGWDLARMMGLDDVIHEEDLRMTPATPRRAQVVEEDRRDENWNQGRVALEIADPSLPRAVVFRDSFGSALIPFLAEHFRRSVHLWRYDFAVDVIEEEKPDVVIWLMTSRRLQWYVPNNPPLPAK
jgi:alginate O-acetyltransferase complex protein AlgJ